MSTEEKNKEYTMLQENFACRKTVKSTELLEALKSAEAYSFVVTERNETYVAVPDPEDASIKYWVAFNGESKERLDQVSAWMKEANRMYQNENRSQAELNELRIGVLSLNNIAGLLNMEESQYMQMIVLVIQAIAERWIKNDKKEVNEENCHIYYELVTKLVATLQRLVAQAQAQVPGEEPNKE